MTAHAMKGDAERCLAAGMDGYVSKPVHFEELARVIARVLPGSVCDDLAPDPLRRLEPPASSPTVPTSERPATCIDRSAALECMAGDEELLREIAGLFVQECPRQLEALGRAIVQGDVAGARRAAHTIKGAVVNFGARAAADLANQIEAIAKDGSLAQVGGLFADLKKQLSGVTAELTVWTSN
jgi:HPt (histidine-containing phosphotransfer) domain-containing protein